MSGVLRCVSFVSPTFTPSFSVRWIKYRRTKIPLPKEIKFEHKEEALRAKGFLRSYKPYDPPLDVSEKLNDIFSKYGIVNDRDVVLDDPAVRFSVLNECYEQFNYSIPNSLLFSMNSVGDIQNFYRTPVETTTPLEEMKNKDLPPNLHIQYEYHRFHPDTDTLFGGVSAFPKRSNVIVSLRGKKKYTGFTAKTSWP